MLGPLCRHGAGANAPRRQAPVQLPLLDAGAHVFAGGQPRRYHWVVRAGTVKTCTRPAHGQGRVLGFHYPGDLIAAPDADPDRHALDALACATTSLCRFPAQATGPLPGRSSHARLTAVWAARTVPLPAPAHEAPPVQRVAAFVLDAARRLRAPHPDQAWVRLEMTRADIGSHLCLAPDAISRILRGFQHEGLLRIARRELHLLAPDRLTQLAWPDAMAV